MDSQTISGLFVPALYSDEPRARGVFAEDEQLPTGMGSLVNDTGLPDDVVMGATRTFFEEHSAMNRGQTDLQMYNNRSGSMLARAEYQAPTNIIEEIKLARDLAERDDDVRETMGAMIALAFSDGMANFHEDDRSRAAYNAACEYMNMDGRLKEIYREYLIASQFTTASLFTNTQLDINPSTGNRSLGKAMTVPLVGVLPAENIRVIGNDMFGKAQLAYDPPDERLRMWLEEFFSEHTTPARKNEMKRQDPVSAYMFIGMKEVDPLAPREEQPGEWGNYKLFLLNPRMCHRTTMPKGSWKHPRPLLTASFALLEAKRLLNIMDYALLQGGSNFIVVAKKGTDARPAQPEEVANLREVVRRASRTGVIVGDHRLTFEIITPKLDELLNEKKRRLLGRKIAMVMLRLPESSDQESGASSESMEGEIAPRVIESDRRDIKRHIEGNVYTEIARRNPRVFKGRATMWFPKIILQGTRYFTDFVLKLRDRGDIPRSWAVAAAGFDWDAAVQVRKGELARGEDEIMQPGSVPHSSEEAGPQDNNEGRPKGAGDGSEKDKFAPKKTITKNKGETVKAWFDETLNRTIRVGEITYAILEEYAESKSEGRVQDYEREAIEAEEPMYKGSVAVAPVNVGVPVHNLKAVRLTDGLSMIVGERIYDGAIMAKALCFREPEYTAAEAETRVSRWGFPLALLPSGGPVEPEESAADRPEPVELHFHTGGAKPRKVKILRDEKDRVIGSEEVEPEPEGE